MAQYCLAVDGMGGDAAPLLVVEGLHQASKRFPDLSYLLFGKKDLLDPLVNQYGLSQVVSIVHCEDVVGPDTKPLVALRNLKDSSMRRAIEAVKEGKAHGVVSAGNTGAYMALSKLLLKGLPGIDRPAIAALMPNVNGLSVVLDLGANLECTEENLVQFAVMGHVFALYQLSVSAPRIGLLNIGSEDIKGHAVLQAVAQSLKNLPLNFYGFVEGDDIAKGTVDVIVTDGFTGNVALKTAEGYGKLFRGLLKESFGGSFLSKLGYLLCRPQLKKVMRRIDPRLYNGAMFLGLNGVAVKSHGGTDGVGFANSIGVAYNAIASGLNERISKDIASFAEQDLMV